MRWLDASVVVLNHFTLLKAKRGIKLDCVLVVHVHMQGDFSHRLVRFNIVQDGLQELPSNSPSTVGRQDRQRHDIQALIRRPFFDGFETSADSADNVTVPVGKLVHFFIPLLDDILVKVLAVGNGKGRRIDLS